MQSGEGPRYRASPQREAGAVPYNQPGATPDQGRQAEQQITPADPLARNLHSVAALMLALRDFRNRL